MVSAVANAIEHFFKQVEFKLLSIIVHFKRISQHVKAYLLASFGVTPSDRTAFYPSCS